MVQCMVTPKLKIKMVLWIFSLYDPQNWANTTYFQEIYAYQQICPTIWPHCSSTLRFFSEESIWSATISFQSVDKHFYGSWLTVVEGHSSALATRSLFHRRKVSLSSSSVWRQWSMKRLMAFLENKVCLNHLSGITFSSFVENKRLSWPVLSLLWKKKMPFIQATAQWSCPTSTRHSPSLSPCFLALGLQHE